DRRNGVETRPTVRKDQPVTELTDRAALEAFACNMAAEFAVLVQRDAVVNSGTYVATHSADYFNLSNSGMTVADELEHRLRLSGDLPPVGLWRRRNASGPRRSGCALGTSAKSDGGDGDRCQLKQPSSPRNHHECNLVTRWRVVKR